MCAALKVPFFWVTMLTLLALHEHQRIAAITHSTFKLAKGEKQFSEKCRKNKKNAQGWVITIDGVQHKGS
jgi:hypothetical protein